MCPCVNNFLPEKILTIVITTYQLPKQFLCTMLFKSSKYRILKNTVIWRPYKTWTCLGGSAHYELRIQIYNAIKMWHHSSKSRISRGPYQNAYELGTKNANLLLGWLIVKVVQIKFPCELYHKCQNSIYFRMGPYPNSPYVPPDLYGSYIWIWIDIHVTNIIAI